MNWPWAETAADADGAKTATASAQAKVARTLMPGAIPGCRVF
jgi:hypothetical protein